MDSFIITIDSADKSKQAETWRQLVEISEKTCNSTQIPKLVLPSVFMKFKKIIR